MRSMNLSRSFLVIVVGLFSALSHAAPVELNLPRMHFDTLLTGLSDIGTVAVVPGDTSRMFLTEGAGRVFCCPQRGGSGSTLSRFSFANLSRL